jgi:hypothetical protein
MPRFIPRPKGHYTQGVTVERVGATVVKFTCPRGHTSTKDFSKGKLSARLGVGGVNKMMAWWNDRITYDCKRCMKEN